MSTGYGWEGLRQVCPTLLGARNVPERLWAGSVYTWGTITNVLLCLFAFALTSVICSQYEANEPTAHTGCQRFELATLKYRVRYSTVRPCTCTWQRHMGSSTKDHVVMLLESLREYFALIPHSQNLPWLLFLATDRMPHPCLFLRQIVLTAPLTNKTSMS